MPTFRLLVAAAMLAFAACDIVSEGRPGGPPLTSRENVLLNGYSIALVRVTTPTSFIDYPTVGDRMRFATFRIDVEDEIPRPGEAPRRGTFVVRMPLGSPREFPDPTATLARFWGLRPDERGRRFLVTIASVSARPDALLDVLPAQPLVRVDDDRLAAPLYGFPAGTPVDVVMDASTLDQNILRRYHLAPRPADASASVD